MSVDMPDDTLTELDLHALRLNECFKAFIRAGFTKTQSTGFIEQMVCEEFYGANNAMGDGDE